MLKATLILHDAYYLDDYPSIDSYLEIIGKRTCGNFYMIVQKMELLE